MISADSVKYLWCNNQLFFWCFETPTENLGGRLPGVGEQQGILLLIIDGKKISVLNIHKFLATIILVRKAFCFRFIILTMSGMDSILFVLLLLVLLNSI